MSDQQSLAAEERLPSCQRSEVLYQPGDRVVWYDIQRLTLAVQQVLRDCNIPAELITQHAVSVRQAVKAAVLKVASTQNDPVKATNEAQQYLHQSASTPEWLKGVDNEIFLQHLEKEDIGFLIREIPDNILLSSL